MVRLSPIEVTSQEAIYLRQIFHTHSSSIINLSLRNADLEKLYIYTNKVILLKIRTLLPYYMKDSIKTNIKEMKKLKNKKGDFFLLELSKGQMKPHQNW